MQYLNYIVSIIIISLFAACETVVTDSLDMANTETLLVVEGGVERVINSDSSRQEVRLTTTTHFLDNNPTPPVKNATVIISDQDNTYDLIHEEGGLYVTHDLVPQVGEIYTLEINWEGKTYTATDILQPVPLIDSVYTEFEEETGITDEGYFLKLNSRDPQGIANYYHYRVYRNNQLITLPDPGNSRTLVLTDEFFDGQERLGVIPNEEVIFSPGDLATVDQIAISEEYYNFLFKIYEITGNQGLSFVGNPPPASVRGNVLSESPDLYRALGFFYAIEIDRQTVTVKE